MFSMSASHVCEITTNLWSLLTLILIIYTSVAVSVVTLTCKEHVDVWHKPESVCDAEGPILLSRALTTDPFRGITILAAFACALLYGYSPSSSPVRAPLCGVLIMIGVAFIVSMFETDAHFYIINLTSGAALFFTCPIWHDFHDAWKDMNDSSAAEWDRFFTRVQHNFYAGNNNHPVWWWVLWVYTCVLGVITGALLYTNDAVRSWVYVVEYVFFWTLFWSLDWTIREGRTIEKEQTIQATQSRHVSIQF